MLSEQFLSINAAETELLMDALPLIAVLIGGADHEIDADEANWAAKLAHIRSYAPAEHNQGKMDELNHFYTMLDETFESRYEAVLKSSPISTEILTEKLSHINPILKKLDHKFAQQLYKSFLSYAEHIAKASGGVLGFGSVSKAERALMSLPMIEPV